MKYLISSFLLLVTLAGQAWGEVKGFTLTEIGDFKYDASLANEPKTNAQVMVDRLYDLGVRTIYLSPRAVMRNPRGVEVEPLTPPAERSQERSRYMRLIQYIRSKQMDVGIRPLVLVVDERGNTPYREVLPNGEVKIWWHGNIQPRDPNAWFESFKNYLDLYLSVARLAGVSEFTIGAEYYSMTVGIEDQWVEHPHGFPGRWLELLRYARSKLNSTTRIMYDINFTDASTSGEAVEEFGGEFARWKYRLVELATRPDPLERVYWENLRDFWLGLDSVGVDMYRSLASDQTEIPDNFETLVNVLSATASRYATQIDNSMFEIEATLGRRQTIVFKEIGFRSIEKGFIRPFEYESNQPQTINIMHQAAAYEAVFRAFARAGWGWFGGVVFWDASVDPSRHGPTHAGFSPLGKEMTESVIKQNWQ